MPVPIHSHARWHASLGLEIPGIFIKAGLQAGHMSPTRKSKLRGGSRMQPWVSLTPNPKPQTRPSVKGPLLMDSPGPTEPLPSVGSACSRDSDPARLFPAAMVQGGSRPLRALQTSLPASLLKHPASESKDQLKAVGSSKLLKCTVQLPAFVGGSFQASVGPTWLELLPLV